MERKLSFGTKVGYGVGMMGEAVAINAFLAYGLFYMTDIAHISPGFAGMIATIGLFFAAFTDLTAGALSDSSKNPKGKRRPFMIKAAIPLGIATVLFYTNWESMPPVAKGIYFVVILAIFWASLSFADMPYNALGAEITEDPDERTQLRSMGGSFSYIGNIIASAGVTTMVGIFMSVSNSDSRAWQLTGLCLGICSCAAYLISAFSTKEKENVDNQAERESLGQIFKKYGQVLKCKAYQPILVHCVFSYAGMCFFTSSYFYYLVYNMAWSEARIATLQLVTSIIIVILSAVFGTFKFDAKWVVFISTGIFGVVSIIAHFLSLGSVGIVIVFLSYTVGMAGFFVQLYTILYDVADIEEYQSGEYHGGYVMSMFYFCSKAVAGITAFAIGWILAGYGYDATALVQTDHALTGISMSTLFITGACYIIAILVLLKYPADKKSLAALREAKAKRDAGEEYSEEEFKSLLN